MNPSHTINLDSLSGLESHNVKTELANYRDKPALRVIEQNQESSKTHPLVIIPNVKFKDGIIETEIAGSPQAGASAGMRGFVGIAFRVQLHGSKFECFYLRPTNGRADDQLRRNHATQYISYPDYPWHKLREENPGVYESYVDLVSGEWTKIKITVSGTKAQLYVHDAKQPSLIVNDLKLGESEGQIALWVGAGTDAHFSSLVVK
ncbi:hypothetical protein HY229_01265 [Candidatus Acetothermia bacterium]|nr:hypothetical protein [Candidatus Acetothermia bacterium]MBI3642718.1 hypothetical protein [Candidatus Acetothermia bacterium]